MLSFVLNRILKKRALSYTGSVFKVIFVLNRVRVSNPQRNPPTPKHGSSTPHPQVTGSRGSPKIGIACTVQKLQLQDSSPCLLRHVVAWICTKNQLVLGKLLFGAVSREFWLFWSKCNQKLRLSDKHNKCTLTLKHNFYFKLTEKHNVWFDAKKWCVWLMSNSKAFTGSGLSLLPFVNMSFYCFYNGVMML